MVRTFGSLLGVSKQTEMLVMTVLTLWANIFDMALFELTSNLEQVWNVSLDVTKFSPEAQSFIKILLSGVVFVRTFSLHMYIAFLIALIWPATFGTRPTLMLPWLTVSAIKNIGAGIVTLTMGIYTCMMYGPVRPACLRFFGSQMLDLSPSFYMWIVGISLYRDLRKPIPVDKVALKLTEEEELNVALRRRKVKSMVDEDILRKQFESRRKFIGTSAVEVKEIFTPSSFEETMNMKISRSLDSLLDAMTAEAEILEAEDFEPLEEGLKLSEKTAKLLGITKSEISRIKKTKQSSNPLLCPVLSQRKQSTDPYKSTSILKTESPIIRLLPETSLYTPNSRPVRPTKSELKSAKDLIKIKSPSDFMATLPESELKLSNYNQEAKKSYTCLTETIFANKNLNEPGDNSSDDVLKRDQDTFINHCEIQDVNDANKFDGENNSKENIQNSNLQPIYPGEENKSMEPNNSNLESVYLKEEEMEFKKDEFVEKNNPETEFVKNELDESEIIENVYEENKFVENESEENEIVVIESIDIKYVEKESLDSKFEKNKVIEKEFDKGESEKKTIVQIYEHSKDYNETLMENKDLPVKGKKEVVAKTSHEKGCQVSTLSKRILNAPTEEISRTLSTIPQSRSSKTRVRPPSCTSQGSKISFRKTKSCSSRKSSDSCSPREHTSYLSIHLNKLDRKNTNEKKKFNIDKFGFISTTSSESTDSRVDISTFFNPYESDENIERKKFDSFKFKY